MAEIILRSLNAVEEVMYDIVKIYKNTINY